MRHVITLVIISIVVNSCKTYSYFTSPNNLANENCQVYLADGSMIEGKLTIQFETDEAAKDLIKIVTKDNVQKQIPTTDIKYYKYNNNFYYPKVIDLQAYEIPGKDKIYLPNVNNLLFLKEVTNNDVKIHLYELYQSRTKSLDGMDHYDYYFSLSSENRFLAWTIRGNKLFPNFEDKMSNIVADCAQLAEKIKGKQQGYYLKQISLDAKKEEIVKRIINEYNGCK